MAGGAAFERPTTAVAVYTSPRERSSSDSHHWHHGNSDCLSTVSSRTRQHFGGGRVGQPGRAVRQHAAQRRLPGGGLGGAGPSRRRFSAGEQVSRTAHHVSQPARPESAPAQTGHLYESVRPGGAGAAGLHQSAGGRVVRTESARAGAGGRYRVVLRGVALSTARRRRRAQRLKSVERALGSREYARLRIGVGRAPVPAGARAHRLSAGGGRVAGDGRSASGDGIM
eukprot:ctg_1860.g520